MTNHPLEKALVSDDEAEDIAKRIFEKSDPLSERGIAPSLLSSEHIREYVRNTGLIAPFYENRLKKASYEGRIGDSVYMYDDSNNLSVVPPIDGFIEIPGSRIVFLKPDVIFRLPPYIAVRFNLHIRHVHRGLLLGTGPLVDPGYWGTLCIPIHNLTSRAYKIRLDEPLLWFEFTKTTGVGGIGKIPSGSGTKDIKQFILKAASNNVPTGYAPIQSSITEKVQEAARIAAKDAAEEATKRANDASNNANAARDAANEAKISSDESKKTIDSLSFFGSIGLVIGAASLVIAINTLVVNQDSFITSEISSIKDYFARVSDEVKSTQLSNTKRSDEIEEIIKEVKEKLVQLERLVSESDRTQKPPISNNKKGDSRAK